MTYPATWTPVFGEGFYLEAPSHLINRARKLAEPPNRREPVL